MNDKAMGKSADYLIQQDGNRDWAPIAIADASTQVNTKLKGRTSTVLLHGAVKFEIHFSISASTTITTGYPIPALTNIPIQVPESFRYGNTPVYLHVKAASAGVITVVEQ